jgi:hypothetical protein
VYGSEPVRDPEQGRTDYPVDRWARASRARDRARHTWHGWRVQLVGVVVLVLGFVLVVAGHGVARLVGAALFVGTLLINRVLVQPRSRWWPRS